MPSRPRHLPAALLAAAAAVALLTSCASSAPTDTDTTSTPAPTATAPAPAVSPTPTEAPAADGPTCETLIPAATVADFESVGWTHEEAPFYIGELEITEGLQCLWADFAAPASDHLQIFGWAPIAPAEAEEAQEALVAQGWVREESDEGVYITENPETTIVKDDQGYGMTYLFADGAVKMADTKQGLILVEWPKS